MNKLHKHWEVSEGNRALGNEYLIWPILTAAGLAQSVERLTAGAESRVRFPVQEQYSESKK